MVTALDQILGRLIAAAPREGADWEVPLTLQEVRAIKLIPPTGSVSMSTLASSMGISLPTATHLVDRLAAKGIAMRTRTEHDRRLVLITLSEKARAHQQAYFESRVDLVVSILEPLGQTERQQVVKALGEIARVVQARAAGPSIG